MAGRGWSELEAAAPHADQPDITDRDLAIVLFTSGTTGRSKGCMLSHRYVVRHAQLMAKHLQLTSDDVLFCRSPSSTSTPRC